MANATANPPHRLRKVDVDARTAECSICGPTRIRVRGGGRGHVCWAVRQREWSKRDRDFRQERYGLSRAEYEAKVAAQGGACAICREVQETLAVDHDHATGAVRDLLCFSCNTAIGLFRERVEALESAVAYINRHARRTCDEG